MIGGVSHLRPSIIDHPQSSVPRASATQWLRNIVVLFWVCGGLTLVSASAFGQDVATSDPNLSATSSGEAFRPPLEPLPDLPNRQFAEPSADDSAVVDAILTRLTSASDIERQSAAADVDAVSESLVPAIYARLNREAQGANRAAMKQLLLDVRRDVRKQLESEQPGTKVETPDYLQMMISQPRTDSADWKRLVNVLALSRMCVGIGTVEAVRTLAHVYVRFEFLRIDTQLQLQKLGEAALPALIETTRHQAPTIAEWAKQQLDFLGKAIPSEAVRVTSSSVLADVLRAYGYIKDPDAARLVLSFASSERSQVRLAARQAIRGFGQAAIWVLRDAYEQTLGTKPSTQWGWDRVAKELFREYDRTRLAEVYGYYERGLKHLDEGKLEAALDEFEGLLRRSPEFQPSDKLVTAFLDYAESDPEGSKDWERAERLLHAAGRLGTPEQQRRARSLTATVHARRLAARGVADQFLLREALDLHEDNVQASRLLSELEKPALTQRPNFQRWFWPSALGVLSVVFLALLLRTQLKRN